MSGTYGGFPYAGGAYAGALAPGASPPSDVGINLPTVTVSLDDGTGTFPYDITQYVEIGSDGGTVSFTRGREDNYGDVQASTCSLTLNNTDGRFTLGSTSIASPTPIYVDNQIRVTFAVGAVSSTRFTGYVQNWPTAWPGGGDKYAVTQVTAVDRLARMSRRVLRSIVEQEILLDTPTAYYTLGEPAASASAGDTSGNAQAALTQAGSGTGVVFGTATGPATDGLTAATFANAKYLSGALAAAINNRGITLEAFFSTDGTDPDGQILQVFTAASLKVQLEVESGFVKAFSGGWNGSAWSGSAVTGPTVTDSAVHHAAAVVEAGGTIRLYLDGVEVGTPTSFATTGTVGHLSVGGSQNEASGPFKGSVAHAAVSATALSAARIAAHSTAGLTGFTSDTSDERIARYASYAGVAAGDMVLEVGVVQNVPHLDITGMSPLAAIAAVNAAELGIVFVRGDGKLVFQNRNHRALQVASDWSFAASPNLQGDLAWTTDMQHVTNYVTASRVDGTVQVARNASSIAKHEQYPTSYDNLLVATDAEALDVANWQVAARAEPGARLPGATMDLMANTTGFRQTWLGIELSDRIAITGLPSQSPASSVDLIVEGWTETLSNSEWTATLNTTPFSIAAAWILDDATYSVLGTTTRLGF